MIRDANIKPERDKLQPGQPNAIELLMAEIDMPTDGEQKKPNYTVKKVETIVTGTDVQARMLTLAPADVIPWHRHSECTDFYFVLRGELTIETRKPDSHHMLRTGDRHRISPGTAHLISNRGVEDCEFLLIQGTGKYDWIKA